MHNNATSVTLTYVKMKDVVKDGEENAQWRVRDFLAAGNVQVEQLRVVMMRPELAASMIFYLDDTLLMDQLSVQVFLSWQNNENIIFSSSFLFRKATT